MKIGRKIFITLFIAMTIACVCVGLYLGGVFGDFFAKPRTFTISFMNGETTVGVVNYTTEDESVLEPEVPQKDGYTGAWEIYSLSNGGDLIVNAVYTPIEYSIKFIDGSARVMKEYTYNIEGTTNYNYLEPPRVPEKVGFIGEWPEEFTTATHIPTVTPVEGQPAQPVQPIFTLAGRFGDIVVAPLYTSKDATPGLKYWFANNDATECYVVGYEGNEENVVIPAQYRNMEVVGITSRENKPAFHNVDNMLSITLPATLTEISANMFVGCDKLVAVYNNTSKSNDIIKGLIVGNNPENLGFVVKEGETQNEILKTYNDFYFVETESNGAYLVGYKGENPVVTLPENYNGSSYSIYKYAFFKNNVVSSITMPADALIIEVGKEAFGAMDNLATLDIGNYSGQDLEYTLYGSNRITSISANGSSVYNVNNNGVLFGTYDNYTVIIKATLTASLPQSGATKIAKHAFANNVMTSLTIPECYTDIEQGAFMGCNNIESLNVNNLYFLNNDVLGGENGVIGDGIIDRTVFLGYYFGANSISENASVLPASLKEITVASGIICSKAFYNANYIETITVQDGVTAVGADAFGGCTSLKNITMPFINGGEGTSFGYFFEGGSASLSNITISSMVAEIPNGALSGFTSVEKLDIPFMGANVTDAQNGIGYIFGGSVPATLKKAYVANGNLNASAFNGCATLDEIKLPGTITIAPDNAFAGCSALKKFPAVYGGSTPVAFTSIGTETFMGCSSLPQYLPDGYVLTSVGRNAFSGSSLKTFAYQNGNYVGTEDNHHSVLISIDASVEVFSSHESTTVIASGAASGCTNLYTLKLKGSPHVSGGAFTVSLLESNIYELYNLGGVNEEELSTSGLINLYAYHTEEEDSLIKEDSNALLWVNSNIYNTVYLLKNLGSAANISLSSPYSGVGSYTIRGAFNDNSTLKELTINISGGNTCTVENNNFNKCTALEKLIINVSGTNSKCNINSTFTTCSALKTVNLTVNGDYGQTSVANGSFSGCAALSAVKVSVSGYNAQCSLGESAFANCATLNEVETDVKSNAYCAIFNYCFSNCATLDNVTLGGATSGYTGVAEGAFSNCVLLTTFTSKNLSVLGQRAFENCSSLTTATVEGSLTVLEDSTFSGCTALTKVELADSITEIKSFAFNNCTQLGNTESVGTSINLPGYLTKIYANAFVNTQLKELYIPNGVNVEQDAFAGTSNGLILLFESDSFESQNAATYIFNNVTMTSQCYYTFDINGGDGEDIEPIRKWYLTPNDLPAEPTREGYTFLGWFTLAMGGDKVTDFYQYSSNETMTFYAQWQKNTPAE